MTQMNNTLKKLKSNKIYDLTEFIVKENLKYHSNTKFTNNHEKNILVLYNEELKFYQNSEIFISKDESHNIIGSIRLLKWNFIDVLPLQKIFDIDPLLVINRADVNNIYHIGRFAIKKDILDIKLFKTLIACAITPICKHKDNIAFAECDSKLLKVLNKLGIKTNIIGKSKNYLGSETVPILINYEGLINFYKKNSNLYYDYLLNNNQIKSSTNANIIHA